MPDPTRIPDAPIVLAGFEPFGRRRVNRSWQAVERVRERPDLERLQLPVDFARLAALIPALVARRPAALLLVGEAARLTRPRVERIALNVLHARIRDNVGARPRLQPIRPGRPLAYEATVPVEPLVRALVRSGVGGEISHHAGTYACNASLYLALDTAAQAQLAVPIGFIHVPRDGVGPGVLARALEACVLTLRGTRAI